MRVPNMKKAWVRTAVWWKNADSSQGRNHTNVVSVESVLVSAPISFDIRERIREKNLTGVRSVGKLLVRVPPWWFTKGRTQERDLISVLTAASASVRALILSGTGGLIWEKNLTNALTVRSASAEVPISISIGRSTQKSLLSVPKLKAFLMGGLGKTVQGKWPSSLLFQSQIHLPLESQSLFVYLFFLFLLGHFNEGIAAKFLWCFCHNVWKSQPPRLEDGKALIPSSLHEPRERRCHWWRRNVFWLR